MFFHLKRSDPIRFTCGIRLQTALRLKGYYQNPPTQSRNKNAFMVRSQNTQNTRSTLKTGSEPYFYRNHTNTVTYAMLMVQYRGNQRQYFANRLRKLTNVQVVLTTIKLESCLPSLKSAISNDLKSRIVSKLSCSRCTSNYVGQTVRHMTTRIEEHKKADSPVGLHLQQCQLEGNCEDLSWEIIDSLNSRTKLLTLEAIHIRKEKPGLNTSDEFRSRELTLKI